MGVVTVSSSAARTPFGLSTRFSTQPSPAKRVTILAFKSDKTKKSALVSPKESAVLSVESSKENPKRLTRVKKPLERVQALSTVEGPSCSLDLDYSEAAATLDRIYKLSPRTNDSDTEDNNNRMKRGRRGRKKKTTDKDEKPEMGTSVNFVRRRRKSQRMNLQERIDLKNQKDVSVFASNQKKKAGEVHENEKISRLVREYSASTELGGFEWRTMKFPQVLPYSEQSWLFKLLQPLKAVLSVKEELQKNLGREPTGGELAKASNMSLTQLRKHMEVGRAARNKLIKHNLRLVFFVMNKSFQEFINSHKFEDLCQAGVRGLMTAIDRFEPGRKLRLSTYSLFWIRHSIIRSMTVSSFIKVPFGLESIRVEIQKAESELSFELRRAPTEEEIAKKVGISQKRYREVMKASKPVRSLHDKHRVTKEELIYRIKDTDTMGHDKRPDPVNLRLAIDDVLDSLNPKESLVIRLRYGLDGKGDRTLGEIAGNLNVSREMVRKYEVKAMMKLKHPDRLAYLLDYLEQ